MHASSPIVVKKTGMFAALFHGLFGLAAVIVICATGLGFYAANVADRKVSDVLAIGKAAVSGLPDLQDALPPVLADVLSDRRDPGYRRFLDVSAKPVESGESHGHRGHGVLVEVTNNGTETVTLLSVRVELEDKNGVPLRGSCVYAATPLAIEDEWHGPLFPGSTRRILTHFWGASSAVRASAEINDLRIWQPPEKAAAQAVDARPVEMPMKVANALP